MKGKVFGRTFRRLLPCVAACAALALSAPASARADESCRPLAAVFYAQSDWLRLAQKLAADSSPCAEYYISVPALVGHKWDPRPDQAWRIRALGPQFHAMAEIHWNAWNKWIADNSSTWYGAGVRARLNMAAAGYDVAAGDLWAINEFHSGIRRNVGASRDNARNFVRGLYDGDGTLPTSRGVVFNIGSGQTLVDASAYKAVLESWFDDAAFWTDMQAHVRYWGQEVYADSVNWGVTGSALETRRDYLTDFLRHPARSAELAPASASVARDFLEAAYTPIANGAWPWPASSGYGSTAIPSLEMKRFVSSQTYALRSSGTGAEDRFGFAWAPNSNAGILDFPAETAGILTRLASAIHESDAAEIGACAPPGGELWCQGEVEGAWFNEAWKSFAFRGDFTLAVSPATSALAAGTATTYTVSVDPSRGFTEPVELSVAGLPEGASAAFSQPSVVAPGSVGLTITTTRSTVPGTHPLTIAGTRTPTTRSAVGELVVRASERPPPSLPLGCTIGGTARNDVLVGTPRRDVICGLGGSDTIRGLGGNDRLIGGGGKDKLFGGSGADSLFGGSGDDLLAGGGGRDVLMGRRGDDRLRARDGIKDTVNGGKGEDRARVDRLDRKLAVEIVV
ncbi:MAG: calcium-binding protein [Gaiellaceae bacterium]